MTRRTFFSLYNIVISVKYEGIVESSKSVVERSDNQISETECRFNKIDIQATYQIAADNEAVDLSRVHMCILPLRDNGRF